MSENQAQKIQKIILGDIDCPDDLKFGNENLKKTNKIIIRAYR